MPVLRSLQVNLGLKADKKLQNDILKMLAIHDAIGEIALYDMVIGKDDPDLLLDYNQAILALSNKGLIDIVLDKHDMMNVIRLPKVLH